MGECCSSHWKQQSVIVGHRGCQPSCAQQPCVVMRVGLGLADLASCCDRSNQRDLQQLPSPLLRPAVVGSYMHCAYPAHILAAGTASAAVAAVGDVGDVVGAVRLVHSLAMEGSATCFGTASGVAWVMLWAGCRLRDSARYHHSLAYARARALGDFARIARIRSCWVSSRYWMLGSTETRLSYATQGGVDVSSITPDAPLVGTGPV